MPNADRDAKPKVEQREDADVSAFAESEHLAAAAMALLGCGTEDDVFKVLGDFLVRVVPNAIVLVNETTPDMEWLITCQIMGLDTSLLKRAADLVGFEIIGRRAAIDPLYHTEVFSGTLTRVPGGLARFASSQLPGPIAEAIARLLGIRDVYTIGIADGNSALGNVHIFTRSPDVEPPNRIIESFARHCFSALADIRKTRELADSARRDALLLRNMVEGLAVHEIILDDKGRPCDYRFIDVNPSFEKMTGLKADDIVGRAVSEVLPGLESAWIERYGVVATTGVSTRFEDYSADLGRYYEVVAYCPQPGQFATIISDITERKQAQDALRESEEKFKYIFDHSSVAKSLTNPSGEAQMNDAFCEMLGYTREELADRATWQQLTFPDDIPETEREMAALIAGEKPSTTYVKRFVRKDGGIVWAEVHSSLRRDHAGDPQYFMTTLMDITETKRIEAELRDRERWLAESQHVANLGHYIFDIARDRWEGSPSLHAVLGSNGLGGTFAEWLEIVHPADRDRLSCYFQEDVLVNRVPFDIDYRIVRPCDGVERWVHGLGTIARDDDGNPTGMFGIIQDITDRKQAERELRDSEAKLNEAQHFAHVGSWAWDIKADHLEWSDEMFHLFGLKRETFSGSLPDVIAAAIHPDDRARVEASNQSVANEANPIALEYRIIWPDQSVHWVWAEAGELVLDDDGNPSRLVGTVQDVTERKQAEDQILRLNSELEERVQERTEELTAANEELVDTNVQLEEATRAKGDFLAAMSHELRTPLNSIIGFSGVLLQGLAGALNDEQGRQVGMMNAAGKHLLSLIDQILDLSKIEAGYSEPVYEEFAVPALAEAVLAIVRPLAEAKSLGLEFVHEPGADLFESDPDHVRQILFNLLGNAVKFTEVGTVSLRVSMDDDHLMFTVADTGCGIAPDDLPHIMESFYQAAPVVTAKSAGTGLGLSISSQLAQSIGGTLDVESEVGVGSTFTLRMPCRAPGGAA